MTLLVTQNFVVPKDSIIAKKKTDQSVEGSSYGLIKVQDISFTVTSSTSALSHRKPAHQLYHTESQHLLDHPVTLHNSRQQ
jgi:hypothetical protein